MNYPLSQERVIFANLTVTVQVKKTLKNLINPIAQKTPEGVDVLEVVAVDCVYCTRAIKTRHRLGTSRHYSPFSLLLFLLFVLFFLTVTAHRFNIDYFAAVYSGKGAEPVCALIVLNRSLDSPECPPLLVPASRGLHLERVSCILVKQHSSHRCRVLDIIKGGPVHLHWSLTCDWASFAARSALPFHSSSLWPLTHLAVVSPVRSLHVRAVTAHSAALLHLWFPLADVMRKAQVGGRREYL